MNTLPFQKGSFSNSKTLHSTLLVFAYLIAMLGIPSQVTAIAPPQYSTCLLIGEWESGQQGNHFHIRVDWDENEGFFKGYLTQQGEASQFVGFTVGENIYTATLTTTVGVINEWAKYRYGSDGVSTGFEWRTGSVDINLWPSLNDGLFYTGIAMKRIGSADPSCQPSSQEPLPNYPYCLLVGEWESQIFNNKYRIQIQWDTSQNLFRGDLSQQGELSQSVGFSMDEFTWSAKVISGTLKEQQKWRYGSNGVSIGYEWRPGQPTINIESPSNGNSFLSPAAGTTLVRVNGSALPTCRPILVYLPLIRQ